MIDTGRLNELANQAEGRLKSNPYPDPRFPPSHYYYFLELLAEEMNPELSVELGVCGGGGSLHLARGWGAGKVLGVDYSWDCPENIIHVKDNFPNFEFLLSDSLRAVNYIKDIYGLIDILFIDSVHTYEHTLNELKAYLPIMNEGGVICFDDLHRETMKGVWEKLPEPKMRFDHLHSGSTEGGFGCIIT